MTLGVLAVWRCCSMGIRRTWIETNRIGPFGKDVSGSMCPLSRVCKTWRHGFGDPAVVPTLQLPPLKGRTDGLAGKVAGCCGLLQGQRTQLRKATGAAEALPTSWRPRPDGEPVFGRCGDSASGPPATEAFSVSPPFQQASRMRSVRSDRERQLGGRSGSDEVVDQV